MPRRIIETLSLNGSFVKSVLKCHVQFCFIASLIAHVHEKALSCLKARGMCNQLQNNRINYEFN